MGPQRRSNPARAAWGATPATNPHQRQWRGGKSQEPGGGGGGSRGKPGTGWRAVGDPRKARSRVAAAVGAEESQEPGGGGGAGSSEGRQHRPCRRDRSGGARIRVRHRFDHRLHRGGSSTSFTRTTCASCTRCGRWVTGDRGRHRPTITPGPAYKRRPVLSPSRERMETVRCHRGLADLVVECPTMFGRDADRYDLPRHEHGHRDLCRLSPEPGGRRSTAPRSSAASCAASPITGASTPRP